MKGKSIAGWALGATFRHAGADIRTPLGAAWAATDAGAGSALALCVIPLWAFGKTLTLLAIGAFLIQVGVQGAWGIIPAHLNELSPAAARGLIPGLAYQLGVLVASPVNTIEYALRDRWGYSWALAGFEIAVITLLAVVVMLGPERKGHHFVRYEGAGTG